jgi:hypothetical protein
MRSAKALRVIDCGHERRCRHRPHTGHGPQPLHALVRPRDRFDADPGIWRDDPAAVATSIPLKL